MASLSGGRCRIRWREVLADGTKRGKSWTVHATRQDAELWAIEVYKAVQATGAFVHPEGEAAARPQPPRPSMSDLRAILVEWLRWRKSFKGMADGSVVLVKSGIRTLLWHLRAMTGHAEEEPIPASVLSVATCTELLQRLETIPTPSGRGRKQTTPCGPTRRRALMGYLYEAWVWAADEKEAWPGVPDPPRVRDKVVPKAPPKPRPPPAPTWEEMDAVIRRATGPTREVLLLQRSTGLRQGQVCALKVGGVIGLDTPTPRLKVTTGKPGHERLGRDIPIAPVLVPLLRELVDGRDADDRLVGTRTLTPSVLQAIFAATEQAGEIRARVWRNEHRTNRRTSHSFRAGFQRGLTVAGVEERVIDFLVGHKGRTTREQHYFDADWPELVDAVRKVPAPDLEPREVDNVVQLRSG